MKILTTSFLTYGYFSEFIWTASRITAAPAACLASSLWIFRGLEALTHNAWVPLLTFANRRSLDANPGRTLPGSLPGAGFRPTFYSVVEVLRQVPDPSNSLQFLSRTGESKPSNLKQICLFKFGPGVLLSLAETVSWNAQRLQGLLSIS